MRRHEDLLILISTIESGNGSANGLAPFLDQNLIDFFNDLDAAVLLVAYNGSSNEFSQLQPDQLLDLRAEAQKWLDLPDQPDFVDMDIDEIERRVETARRQIRAGLESFLSGPRRSEGIRR